MTRALALSWLLVASGCPDIESTDTPDVDVDVAVDPDLEGSCFMSGCFDNDPCTEDRCQQSGVCLFVPNEPENACLQDSHCDTGTQCLIGRCEVNDCGLKRCNFEQVPECRPCGPMFGGCFDGDPCTPDVCDEARALCEPRPAALECDSRCSAANALTSAEVQWMGPGFDGSFVGRLHVATPTCESGCECDVPLSLKDWDSFAPVLVDAQTGQPMTCRLNACGAAPAFDCGARALGREVVVFGTTIRLKADKDAAGAPAEDAAAPPRGDADAIEVSAMCPSTRAILDGGDGGRWRATLEREGLTATALFEPAPNLGLSFVAIECDG
ncbi:MAG TPA: hypothetical protein PK095_14320, partial [Myxococcota bacterium]|nr:hypothetical protein [Myxococcota bacterium]